MIVTCRCNQKYEVNKATPRHQLNGFWVTYCPYCSAEHYLRSLSATEKKNLAKSGMWSEEEKALEDIATGKKKLVVQDGETLIKELDRLVNKKQAD